MKTRHNKKQGFTLIELLVVISVISLLATLAITALDNARKRSRDSKRLSDLRQLTTALELYYDTYHNYPGSNYGGEGTQVAGCMGGWDCSHINQDGAADGDFMEFLFDTSIMPILPDDPIDDNNHHYKYFFYNWDAYGCIAPFYVLVGYGFEAGQATGDNVCYTVWANRSDVYVIIGGYK